MAAMMRWGMGQIQDSKEASPARRDCISELSIPLWPSLAIDCLVSLWSSKRDRFTAMPGALEPSGSGFSSHSMSVMPQASHFDCILGYW